MAVFLSIISLMLNEKFGEQISKLYEVIADVETFTKVINTFSDMSLHIPEREDFKNCMILALSYYYRKMKDKTWDEIKKEFPFESGVALKTGKGIVQLDKTIQEKLEEILSEEEIDRGIEELR
jgi:hypothetical protein